MDIRPYEPRDRDACLSVFDSLTPALLPHSARPSFEAWLDTAADTRFVMEHDEAIVGCGGYSLSPDRAVATLEWGMVHRNSQNMGLGRFLLLYRIREIGKHGTVGIVVAHPPEPSAGFFLKQGFRPGTGPMEFVKKLTVCA
jgi:GNAT superfamily N-acetyltransferase